MLIKLILRSVEFSWSSTGMKFISLSGQLLIRLGRICCQFFSWNINKKIHVFLAEKVCEKVTLKDIRGMCPVQISFK